MLESNDAVSRDAIKKRWKHWPWTSRSSRLRVRWPVGTATESHAKDAKPRITIGRRAGVRAPSGAKGRWWF